MDEKLTLPIENLDPRQAKKILDDLQKNKPAFDTAVLDDQTIFSATDEIAGQTLAAPVKKNSTPKEPVKKATKISAEASGPKVKKEAAAKAERLKPAQSSSIKKEDATVKTPEGKQQIGDKQEKENVNWGKEIRDWVVAIVIAVALSLVIRNFVFTLVKVQGASMEPTLHNADRLYVNRFFYTPKKGDVIIFKPSSDPKRPYVKRVIATEGDSLYIDTQSGDVYVNDQLVEEPYIKDKTIKTGNYITSLINKDEYGLESPIVIQPGHIFVMGDNRNNSKDSRDLGQIPMDEIMGGAVFRFWPMDKFGSVHRDAMATSFLTDEINSLPEDDEYGLG